MARRLGEADTAGVGSLLTEGLNAHFNSQEHSSPYETLAERIELSDEAQALCFLAGANSIFLGETLLTTPNAAPARDEALFQRLGLRALAESPRASACGA